MKPKQFPKLTAIFSRKNQLKENRKGKAKPPS
jgi:hypothetical protein